MHSYAYAEPNAFDARYYVSHYPSTTYAQESLPATSLAHAQGRVNVGYVQAHSGIEPSTVPGDQDHDQHGNGSGVSALPQDHVRTTAKRGPRGRERGFPKSASRSRLITPQLEHEIRVLGDYGSGSRQVTAPPSIAAVHQQGWTGPNSRLSLPQRGAKEGNILNLSCQACMRRKMKCSKNYPCTECQETGQECMPSTRKRRMPGTTHDADPPEQLAQSGGHSTQPEATAPPDGTTPTKRRKGFDYDNPSRKLLLNLPRPVGTHQHWSNKTLPYHPVPTDVDAIREKFFEMKKPLLLTSQQYADYWPHVSNVYNREKAPVLKPNGTVIEVYACRNERRQRKERLDAPSTGEGIRNRKKKNDLLECLEPCRMKVKLLYHIKHNFESEEDHRGPLGNCRCVPEWLHVDRTSGGVEHDVTHNHSLESLDKFKRSDALAVLGRMKVEEGGYMYAAVLKWIKQKYGHLSKQIEYLTDHDVANAARPWRVAHRDIELIENISEPGPEEERRDKCLGIINTTTIDGLRRALEEVCKQIPAAVELALPFLESAQERRPEDHSQDLEKGIVEGDDIEIPEPGMPKRYANIVAPAVPVATLPELLQQMSPNNLPPPQDLALHPFQPAPLSYHRHSLHQGSHSAATPSISQPTAIPTQKPNAPYSGSSVAVNGQRTTTPNTSSQFGPPTATASSAAPPTTLRSPNAAVMRPPWARPAETVSETLIARSADAGLPREMSTSQQDEINKQLDAELRGS